MPLQATSGAASYDAFGGGVAAVPQYIEDVFGTFLYTGNGSTQTITNGIDLSTKGGLVWYKDRTTAYEHQLVDTVRGAGFNLETPNTSAQASRPTALTAFNTTGFTLGSNAAANGSGDNFVSWTFREAPKFFDVVTYTGNGVDGRAISHNLGSAPGCIIVKRTDSTSNWNVYHRQAGGSGAAAFWGRLNTTDADTDLENVGPSGTPTTTFLVYDASLGLDSCNINGATYVAYLFAHNAGGFGLTGTDNVISCGSMSGNGTVDLGFEPQWILWKRSDNVSNWLLQDNMCGFPIDTDQQYLRPNTSNAETAITPYIQTTSTGFKQVGLGWNIIYIAIRRGPMKVPTSGTSVFSPVAQTIGTGSLVTTGFVTDAGISRPLSSSTGGLVESRLTGNRYMQSSNTDAESAGPASWAYMNGYSPIPWSGSGLSSIAWAFRRAPSFFDEVCYTGTGANRTVAHNLTVAPELIICKKRQTGNTSDAWWVYSANVPNPTTNRLILNSTIGANINSATPWNSTAPTSSVFSLGTYDGVNETGLTFVSYLFATCAGVSKVGSYTGTATTKQIDCAFTGGARFVLIKRTDDTGDWYVWDSARGIVSGNDPYLLLNSTAAEVTNTDYVDTYSAGFEISSTAPAAINASGGSFIFFAVA